MAMNDNEGVGGKDCDNCEDDNEMERDKDDYY